MISVVALKTIIFYLCFNDIIYVIKILTIDIIIYKAEYLSNSSIINFTLVTN